MPDQSCLDYGISEEELLDFPGTPTPPLSFVFDPIYNSEQANNIEINVEEFNDISVDKMTGVLFPGKSLERMIEEIDDHYVEKMLLEHGSLSHHCLPRTTTPPLSFVFDPISNA